MAGAKTDDSRTGRSSCGTAAHVPRRSAFQHERPSSQHPAHHIEPSRRALSSASTALEQPCSRSYRRTPPGGCSVRARNRTTINHIGRQVRSSSSRAKRLLQQRFDLRADARWRIAQATSASTFNGHRAADRRDGDDHATLLRDERAADVAWMAGERRGSPRLAVVGRTKERPNVRNETIMSSQRLHWPPVEALILEAVYTLPGA
jgi:hypothetical protein